MKSFFKDLIKKNNKEEYSDDIINYLINEIEDIVSKKVDGLASSAKIEKYKRNISNNNDYLVKNNNLYSNNVNYSLRRSIPPRVTKYINNDERNSFLPFQDEEITPNIKNERQIKSIIRQTLRPALNEWLDENLDDIIDRAIEKRQTRRRNLTRKNEYYD